MRQKIYCLASPVRDNSSLSAQLADMRNLLREHNIPYTSPKLGDHLTFVPPFYATPDEARFMAVTLSLCRAFANRANMQTLLYGDKIDHFTGENSDAIVVRFRMSDILRRQVEITRSAIGDTNHFVYPPTSPLFNPHVTVAEGPGLHQLTTVTHPDIFKKIGVVGLVTALEPPLVWTKDSNHRIWCTVRL